ncbi:hypothetical protein [Bacillus massiliglaciei]|uniref:hypothetical protein n=1 Tax=Bacillus massiliglaciei TaxID=1816693 RepID=UPI000DA61C17|nr:hypothetical protein [Bacillus massiliglaciei]
MLFRFFCEGKMIREEKMSLNEHRIPVFGKGIYVNDQLYLVRGILTALDGKRGFLTKVLLKEVS